ncbi:MAG: helix-turn-helix transcriptional regulator [Alphaproteobacteria bacterium]|nr:helix-turn-helix transcriptional regulator [Alphaproteobacteria bacterium]
MSDKTSLIGPQCVAARGLVGWSRSALAEASGVSMATLADFEAGKRQPYDRTLRDIQSALESAGVVFLPNGESKDGGPGVRLRRE